MVTMPLKVVLGSLNMKKGTDSFYADFMFLGGMVSIQVSKEFADRLKVFSVGSEFTAVFEMRPRSVLTVPRLPCLTDEEHKKLFLEVVFCLENSSFAEEDGEVSSKLCQLSKVQKWESSFSYEPSYFDASSFPIHEYAPSDYMP